MFWKWFMFDQRTTVRWCIEIDLECKFSVSYSKNWLNWNRNAGKRHIFYTRTNVKSIDEVCCFRIRKSWTISSWKWWLMAEIPLQMRSNVSISNLPSTWQTLANRQTKLDHNMIWSRKSLDPCENHWKQLRFDSSWIVFSSCAWYTRKKSVSTVPGISANVTYQSFGIKLNELMR